MEIKPKNDDSFFLQMGRVLEIFKSIILIHEEMRAALGSLPKPIDKFCLRGFNSVTLDAGASSNQAYAVLRKLVASQDLLVVDRKDHLIKELLRPPCLHPFKNTLYFDDLENKTIADTVKRVYLFVQSSCFEDGLNLKLFYEWAASLPNADARTYIIVHY